MLGASGQEELAKRLAELELSRELLDDLGDDQDWFDEDYGLSSRREQQRLKQRQIEEEEELRLGGLGRSGSSTPMGGACLLTRRRRAGQVSTQTRASSSSTPQTTRAAGHGGAPLGCRGGEDGPRCHSGDLGELWPGEGGRSDPFTAAKAQTVT